MKIKILVVILLSSLFISTNYAADQDLNAEGKKNLRSANMHLKAGRYERALPLYEEVLEINPHHIESLKNVGSIFFDIKNDYKKALEYFTKTQDEIDDIYAEYEQLLLEDEKEAGKFFKKYIKKADLEDIQGDLNNLIASSWVKLFNDAKEYFDNEDYETALNKFLYVYEIAPDSIQTTKMLAYTYSRLNMPDESLQYMIKSAEMDKTDDFVRTNIGNVYYQNGEYEEAIKWYQEAAEINPEVIDNHFNMALAYMSLQDDENTMYAFERVLEIDPENLDAIVNISNIAARLEDHEKSMEYLKKAVEVDPENEEFVSILTYKLAQDKKFEEVLKYAEKWKELNPESEDAQQLIDLAKQRMKN